MKRTLPLGLVLVSCALGCGVARQEYVRPWFREVTSEKYVIAPHAIAWGGESRPEVLVDGDWRRLPHDTAKRGDYRVHRVGDAIAVDEYTFFDPERREPCEDQRRGATSGVFIYHEGRVTPIHIPPARCATREFTETPAEITCFGCGDAAPLRPLGPACGVLHVETFDTFGRSVARRALASPAELPFVDGRLPTGEWIIAEHRFPDDFLFFAAPHLRFRLDPGGFTALPFGADPFHVDPDAEARAAKILREVPVRDAAVAPLRAAFAEDERAHPSWIVRAEVVDRISANYATKREVRVQPGTCYTVVARASEGLTRVDLSLHHNTLFVRSGPPSSEGLLGMASGAPEVRLSRCVAPGDPAVFYVRVGAGLGAGYVLARVYAHPPSS